MVHISTQRIELHHRCGLLFDARVFISFCCYWTQAGRPDGTIDQLKLIQSSRFKIKLTRDQLKLVQSSLSFNSKLFYKISFNVVFIYVSFNVGS